MKGYLRYIGVSDRVLLSDQKQGWLGFWDWDSPELPYNSELKEIGEYRSFMLCGSGAGYHIIAFDIRDWKEKERWFKTWRECAEANGLKPDYIIQRDNVLRLNSKNGTEPKFLCGYGRFIESASEFHLSMMKVEKFYQRTVPTIGRLKVYTSDPNGIFDVIIDAGTG